MSARSTAPKNRSRISVVIPTRNRPDAVRQLLKSLEHQSLIPDEVIIVDSGEVPLRIDDVKTTASWLTVRIFREQLPSVCAQRNRGVREATGDIIFLCDDDMEARVDYIESLSEILNRNRDSIAVSGMIFEPGISESEAHPMPVLSAAGLLWKFFFLQSVWADLQRVYFPPWLRWAKKTLIGYYQKRGNTFTLAGWPIVATLASPVFETALYGLGASMIRREFLLIRPFPLMLVPQGIGDHYGMAVEIAKSGKKITVLRNTTITHHKSQAERLPAWEAYYWRVMALDLFLDELPGVHSVRRILLLWSLVGNIISFGANREFMVMRSALTAFARISLRINPYRRSQRLSGHLPAETGTGYERSKTEVRP